MASVLILSSTVDTPKGVWPPFRRPFDRWQTRAPGPKDPYLRGLLPPGRASGLDRGGRHDQGSRHRRPGGPFKVCLDLIRIHRVSALPVVSEDASVLGIVSEADLLAREEACDARPARITIGRSKSPARTAANAMTSPALTIAPTASVPEAARLMRKAHVKRLPVVPELMRASNGSCASTGPSPTTSDGSNSGCDEPGSSISRP